MGIVLYEDLDGDLYLLDEDRITMYRVDQDAIDAGAHFTEDAATIEAGEGLDYWAIGSVELRDFDFEDAESIAVYDAGNVTRLSDPGPIGRDYLQSPDEPEDDL